MFNSKFAFLLFSLMLLATQSQAADLGHLSHTHEWVTISRKMAPNVHKAWAAYTKANPHPLADAALQLSSASSQLLVASMVKTQLASPVLTNNGADPTTVLPIIYNPSAHDPNARIQIIGLRYRYDATNGHLIATAGDVPHCLMEHEHKLIVSTVVSPSTGEVEVGTICTQFNATIWMP